MRTIIHLVSIAALCVMSSFTFAATLRVDANATGEPVDGATWTQAYRGLQAALAVAADGDEIWLIEGTYYPSDIP